MYPYPYPRGRFSSAEKMCLSLEGSSWLPQELPEAWSVEVAKGGPHKGGGGELRIEVSCLHERHQVTGRLVPGSLLGAWEEGPKNCLCWAETHRLED